MIRATVLALGMLTAPAIAHDFWIAPDHYRAKTADAEIRATFRIGTAAEPEDWNLRRERVVALRSFGPGGVTDQQSDILPGEPGFAALRFPGPGSHVVTIESTPIESDLPAAEFNDYVRHEGLTEVIAWRTANGKTGANGREIYARRAKAIVQVGSKLTDVTRPLGLSLEIVPEKHPLSLADGEALPLRVYFRGKPLPGLRLTIESLSAVTGANSETVTDGDGRTAFSFPRQGAWKIASVWSVPIEREPRADFDTLFASLTFGY